MSIKSNCIFKIIALALCFSLVFEQSGFAQAAGAWDLSARFARLPGSFAQEQFRPVHLRYIAYDNLKNNFKLLLDQGDSARGLAETKTLLNYFFIGISLPNSSFWVNLRPDSPDNVIDPLLEQTDLGRVLLEADVQLKKDTSLATSPQTPEGREYWDKLYKKAGELYGSENITIPTLTRPWIVPHEIIIRESTDNAYIYKATLKVMLESDYLAQPAGVSPGASPYQFKDERSRVLNEYSSQLIRELIIPKLTKDVNTAKRYAPLRQAYYSLILAQWFKQKFYGKGGLYSSLIDRRNLTGLTSQGHWSKATYFEAYKKSFSEGEYNIQENAYVLGSQTIRSYVSGGISILGPDIAAAEKTGAKFSGSPLRAIAAINPKGITVVEVAGGTSEAPYALDANPAAQGTTTDEPVAGNLVNILELDDQIKELIDEVINDPYSRYGKENHVVRQIVNKFLNIAGILRSWDANKPGPGRDVDNFSYIAGLIEKKIRVIQGDYLDLYNFTKEEEPGLIKKNYTEAYRKYVMNFKQGLGQKIASRMAGFMAEINKDFEGLLNEITSVSELLNLIHVYVLENQYVIPQAAKAQQDNAISPKVKEAISRRMNELMIGDEPPLIFIFPFKNRVYLQVRDYGHALSIIIDESPGAGKLLVTYKIPKAFGRKYVEQLSGFTYYSEEQGYARGQFVIEEDNLGDKIVDFIKQVPSDVSASHSFKSAGSPVHEKAVDSERNGRTGNNIIDIYSILGLRRPSRGQIEKFNALKAQMEELGRRIEEARQQKPFNKELFGKLLQERLDIFENSYMRLLREFEEQGIITSSTDTDPLEIYPGIDKGTPVISFKISVKTQEDRDSSRAVDEIKERLKKQGYVLSGEGGSYQLSDIGDEVRVIIYDISGEPIEIHGVSIKKKSFYGICINQDGKIIWKVDLEFQSKPSPGEIRQAILTLYPEADPIAIRYVTSRNNTLSGIIAWFTTNFVQDAIGAKTRILILRHDPEAIEKDIQTLFFDINARGSLGARYLKDLAEKEILDYYDTVKEGRLKRESTSNPYDATMPIAGSPAVARQPAAHAPAVVPQSAVSPISQPFESSPVDAGKNVAIIASIKKILDEQRKRPELKDGLSSLVANAIYDSLNWNGAAKLSDKDAAAILKEIMLDATEESRRRHIQDFVSLLSRNVPGGWGPVYNDLRQMSRLEDELYQEVGLSTEEWRVIHGVLAGIEEAAETIISSASEQPPASSAVEIEERRVEPDSFFESFLKNTFLPMAQSSGSEDAEGSMKGILEFIGTDKIIPKVMDAIVLEQAKFLMDKDVAYIDSIIYGYIEQFGDLFISKEAKENKDLSKLTNKEICAIATHLITNSMIFGMLDIKAPGWRSLTVDQIIQIMKRPEQKITASNLKKVAEVTIWVIKKSSASSALDAKGGIDLTNLPGHMAIQPIQAGNSFLGASSVLHSRKLFPKEEAQLKQEWQEIENTLKAGIVPSPDRLRRYLEECCASSSVNQEVDKVLSCLAQIMRMEEDRVENTAPALKEMLILLESDKPANEMQVVLAKLVTQPKATETIGK